MTTIGSRIFQFAAGFVLVGASAFAQDVIRVNVPFNFEANGKTMKAGVYDVQARSNAAIIEVTNIRGGGHVFRVATPLGSPKPNTEPRLVFRCNDETCSLAQVWTSAAGYGYSTAKPADHEHMVSIPAVSVSAD
jgi:hypothetical protein